MNGQSLSPKRITEIAGLICLALSLFLLLALLSYHPLDPSLRHYYGPENVSIHNLTGSVGSYVADTLLWFMGLGIIWLPAMLLVVALRYFRDPEFGIGPAVAAGTAGLIFATSSLFGLLVGDVTIYANPLDTGGLLGSATAKLLDAHLRLAGSLIILGLVLIVALMILFDFSVVSFAGKSAAAAGKAAKSGGSLFERLRAKFGAKQDEPPFEEKPAAPPAPVIEEVKRETLKEKLAKAEQTHFDFTSRVSGKFRLPPLNLLDRIERKDTRIKRDALIGNSRILEKKLADFGVEGKVVEVKPGPVITMYELEPAPGVKINKITNLSDDLALALRAPSIRIIAPIPGRGAIGIEIPNQEREPVRLRDILDHAAFKESPCRLPIALGEDIVGNPVITELIRMPHLLIAGTTGSGKSVSLNAMICSILFKAPPEEVKFIMIDPKRLELSGYEGIPHLLHPVVVDPKKASLVLRWAVEEMERRYRIISAVGVKSIEGYNRLQAGKKPLAESAPLPNAAGAGEAGSEEAADGDEAAAGGNPVRKAAEEAFRKVEPLPDRLPYIVIIIDELADLMMVAQRNVEESLTRLAQMARAAGIHLILATQRPSVDVITGIIKANFPTRISFKVSSKVDSRTILDQLGAEKLLGAGDMLFIPPGTSLLTRIHGAYVSDTEIDRIVDFVKKQGKPAYDQSITEYEPDEADAEKPDEEFDEKYDEAVALVTDLGQASISLVQRYLKIGYNRAAGIIERMEAEGVVGPADGAKPRKVLARKIPHG
jgi:S-DNA-T family DNA segregation ATPase FtsK/SpoIIIE